MNYGYAFSFKYSTRPGTPAAERAQVAEDEKSERLYRLQDLLSRQQRAAQEAMMGEGFGGLFEKPSRVPGQTVGKSDHLHAVHVTDSSLQPGDLRRVRITESTPNALGGVLV